MLADIALQQPVSEVFTTTNNRRSMGEGLGQKAVLILGEASTVIDYHRQTSVNHAIASSFQNSNFTSQPKFVNLPPIKKEKSVVTLEQLVPLILKLVSSPNLPRLPSTISRPTNVEHDDDIDENDLCHRETDEETFHRSDVENDADDRSNLSDPQTFSLSDFLSQTDPPLTSTIKQESEKLNPSKHELIRSFSSSVNLPIDIKQPILPISIPKHLFLDQTTNQSDGKAQRTNKRSAEISNLPEEQSKRTKIDMNQIKQEPISVVVKTEPNVFLSTNSNQTVREKPTASVKPLLQSSMTENFSTNNVNTSVNPSREIHSNQLKNKSMSQLDSIARQKKRQADSHRRTTFDEIRQTMSLYLESICYFLQCANVETVVEQRSALLATMLPMLQQLVQNHQKMFHLSTNNSSIDLLFNLRQRFLLINYWLQSFIYHLQFQSNWSSIERYASQVTEYFSHHQSPTSDSNQSIAEFSKLMLLSYNSTHLWNKADRLMREDSMKEFLQQLQRLNQNRRLSRDEKILDFILYIFDAIDSLRSTNP